jgi:hypothetical protein
VSAAKYLSRSSGVSCFESFNPHRVRGKPAAIQSHGKITAAATTGPASGPRTRFIHARDDGATALQEILVRSESEICRRFIIALQTIGGENASQ